MRVLLALVVAACEPTVTTTLAVADGWEATPPEYLLGPTGCAPRADDRVIVATPSGSWQAHAGKTTIPCMDGAIYVTVEPIATFELRAPTSITVDSDWNAEVVATSVGGTPLHLDDSVAWSTEGPIGHRPHSDMDVIGPAIEMIRSPQLFSFRGGAAGTLAIHVQWHGHGADAKVTIR